MFFYYEKSVNLRDNIFNKRDYFLRFNLLVSSIMYILVNFSLIVLLVLFLTLIFKVFFFLLL